MKAGCRPCGVHVEARYQRSGVASGRLADRRCGYRRCRCIQSARPKSAWAVVVEDGVVVADSYLHRASPRPATPQHQHRRIRRRHRHPRPDGANLQTGASLSHPPDPPPQRSCTRAAPRRSSRSGTHDPKMENQTGMISTPKPEASSSSSAPVPPVTCGIAVSVDGFAAGPHQGLDHPIGEGGDRLPAGCSSSPRPTPPKSPH